ncbi:hypothetical protein Clacol_008731 [Clathrus columnatus]|uniref:AMP-dependent synthetase/ligase domain-containing protein n=1 Tax=Clathrus columnatus TaxID=1419009 RepID=A0AAV5AL33_9AGAM|nr:hypothetical protein Clacol_008731 [Clathrus columnatus]
MSYVSHYTFIELNATCFPQRLAFKLPQLESDDTSPHQKILGWTDITYEKFLGDINWCAGYWLRKLQCPRGSLVGLWMSGLVYRDFVHLFGLIKAGFVPQLLNLKVHSIEIATEYFRRSNITHIIYASNAPAAQLGNDFQIHEIIDRKLDQSDKIADLHEPVLRKENGDDVVLIFNSSGSTSGKPKLIPYTRKWIDGHARKPIPGLPNGTEIGIGINGIIHGSQFAFSLQQFQNGACVVLMPWLEFTGPELIQIITECKANVLSQLTPIFSKTLREAMVNSELRAALKSLSFVGCGGSVFGDNERLWAMELGILVKNIYGTTEMGVTMLSGRDPIILHPFKLPGFVYEFIDQDAEAEIKTKNANNRLVEAIVPSSSLDCPYPTFRDPIDGHFHTRDLFEEVEPNGFTYRGRLDDMIKMSKGQKCSTLFIESQVLLTCKDLVSACVVVGSGKPSPVLLVEPLEETTDTVLLKEMIGKKAELINKDGFPHERVRSSDILIVPSGTIPRTPKGNINRNAAERLFQQEIDAFFDEE